MWDLKALRVESAVLGTWWKCARLAYQRSVHSPLVVWKAMPCAVFLTHVVQITLDPEAVVLNVTPTLIVERHTLLSGTHCGGLTPNSWVLCELPNVRKSAIFRGSCYRIYSAIFVWKRLQSIKTVRIIHSRFIFICRLTYWIFFFLDDSDCSFIYSIFE